MTEQRPLVTVYLMGEAFKVPESATIMGALEYAGFQLKRGIGCREGFCGACATLYREAGDYRLQGGLACQTAVNEGMTLSQIPFVPAKNRSMTCNRSVPVSKPS
jgi:ferredoxin